MWDWLPYAMATGMLSSLITQWWCRQQQYRRHFPYRGACLHSGCDFAVSSNDLAMIDRLLTAHERDTGHGMAP